jgi:hypothetical protein
MDGLTEEDIYNPEIVSLLESSHFEAGDYVFSG